MFQKYIDGQYRRPTGLVGRWIGRKMAQQHVPENQWTVELLDVQPDDHILEIGFGPGIAIEAVAKCAVNGRAAGIDFSRTMVATAKKRNAKGVGAGQIDLRYGDAASLPFNDNTFEKAFSIHSIYFWSQPLDVLREIHRVLKPSGMVIITVLPKEKWNPNDPEAPVGTPECKPYSGDELIKMLRSAGFTQTDVKMDDNREYPSNFSVIGIK
jgi:ubiquinone/menaquinone biosynthesis C-methylase UbiE